MHEYTEHTSPENIKSFCCCCSCGTPYGHFDALKDSPFVKQLFIRALFSGIVFILKKTETFWLELFFFFYSKQHATWSVHPASHLRALFFCPSVTWQRFPCRGIYCFHALSLRVFTQFPVLSQRLKPTLSGLIAFWKVRVILNSFSVFKYSTSTWSGEVIYYIMNIHVTYYQRG